MRQYITPVQFSELNSHGEIGVNFHGVKPVVYVLDRRLSVPPTLANVRRLLRALRGEMSDAELALEIMRVIEDVLLECDENGFYSVWERDRIGINMICGDYSPLTAARAAAAELGVELPEHLRGGA